MNATKFWELIEQTRSESSGNSSKQVELLQSALIQLGKEEIIDFENLLNANISALSNFDVLAANFMIQSYVSDDIFVDFRAWLIAQGKERYEAALENVESISEWLNRDEVEEIDGSDFVTVAVQAYREAGGSEDDFYEAITFPDQPDFEQSWPDDKDGFAARWPNLCNKFWNLERIRELHAND